MLQSCEMHQFKHKNMTNVTCFHGQHFSCLEKNTTPSACLCNYFERN